MSRDLLEVTDLVTGFGPNTVLHGVSLQVREGEIAAILGLNGAGKSVTMKVIGGIHPPWSGSITLEGKDITRLSAEERVAGGMAHVPQGRQVFPELTVEQNLRLGAYTLRRRDKSKYAPLLASLYERFPILAQRRTQFAGSLSGGEQATLALSRALMSEPKLVLVDEASAGLSPIMIDEVFGVLSEINKSGVTILMVEQNVTFSLKIADRVNIMQSGSIVYRGETSTLDRARLSEYLGVGSLLGAGVDKAAKKRAGRGIQSPKGPKPKKRTAKKKPVAKRSAKKKT